MKEYDKISKMYSSPHFSIYSLLIEEDQWGNTKKASDFLEKFWLSTKEYEDRIHKTIYEIFSNTENIFPGVSFKDNYNIFHISTANTLSEIDIELIKKISLEYKDEHFYLIENNLKGKIKNPTFRMKFPIDIVWGDLMTGNYISSALFEMPYNEYFIVGDSCHWGIYSTNEYYFPMNIYGFDNNKMPSSTLIEKIKALE